MCIVGGRKLWWWLVVLRAGGVFVVVGCKKRASIKEKGHARAASPESTSSATRTHTLSGLSPSDMSAPSPCFMLMLAMTSCRILRFCACFCVCCGWREGGGPRRRAFVCGGRSGGGGAGGRFFRVRAAHALIAACISVRHPERPHPRYIRFMSLCRATARPRRLPDPPRPPRERFPACRHWHWKNTPLPDSSPNTHTNTPGPCSSQPPRPPPQPPCSSWCAS